MSIKKKVTLIILLVLSCSIVLLFYMKTTKSSLYMSSTSPNKMFFVEVYKKPMLLAFPGGGSDAPGIVKLIDQNGRVLKQGKIDMVQMVEKIKWEEKSVYIEPIGSWKLP